MKFLWNEQKNEELKKHRNISFEEIAEALNSNAVLDIRQHPNKQKYPKQFLMYVEFKNYVFVIPFVYKNKTTIFLKTIFKSRKAKREFNV